MLKIVIFDSAFSGKEGCEIRLFSDTCRCRPTIRLSTALWINIFQTIAGMLYQWQRNMRNSILLHAGRGSGGEVSLLVEVRYFFNQHLLSGHIEIGTGHCLGIHYPFFNSGGCTVITKSNKVGLSVLVCLQVHLKFGFVALRRNL